MDRFEGFGKSTPLNPRLRNRWVYKRSSWQRKATYNCGLYYRRWTGTWSSLDIFYTNNVKEGEKIWFSASWKCCCWRKGPGNAKDPKTEWPYGRKFTLLQPQLRINGKKKVAISFLSTKVKRWGGGDEKHEEEAGILEDFDYHDNINAESYEKYFENVCKLLKPNSVIIIDNASYHSRNADDFPVSKWKNLSFKIG